MAELPLGVFLGIIIKEKHGLGIHSIRIQSVMIGECVMGPVLTHPIVFTSSNGICSESEQIIDPGSSGSRTVIGIVLDVESNQCLGDSECDCHFEGGGLGGPEVVEGEVEGDVEDCAGEVAVGSEFLSATDYFEYFFFDLAFEIRVEYVAVVIGME